MKYVAECRYAEINGKPEPESFYILLNSESGAGKRFSIDTVT